MCCIALIQSPIAELEREHDVSLFVDMPLRKDDTAFRFRLALCPNDKLLAYLFIGATYLCFCHNKAGEEEKEQNPAHKF